MKCKQKSIGKKFGGNYYFPDKKGQTVDRCLSPFSSPPSSSSIFAYKLGEMTGQGTDTLDNEDAQDDKEGRKEEDIFVNSCRRAALLNGGLFIT